MRRSVVWHAGLAAGLLAGTAAAQPHHQIIDIGRNSTNVLEMHSHAPQPIGIPPSPFSGIPGYATAEVAFESLMAPNAHGALPLLAGSDIRVELVAISPGLSLYGGANPLPIGGELTLGTPFFHFLPIWSIAPGPLGGTFSATLRARDASGQQTPSPTFDVTFTAIPAPGASALLAAGLLATRRRRS